MSSSYPDAAGHQDPSPHGHSHPASLPMLVAVFVALLGLTVVTVAVAYVDLGEANLFVAMAIATAKALLVSLFFMHLAHDTGFNRLAFFASFAFIGLFVSFTLMDSGQSQVDVDWHERVLPAAEANDTPAGPAGAPAPAANPEGSKH